MIPNATPHLHEQSSHLIEQNNVDIDKQDRDKNAERLLQNPTFEDHREDKTSMSSDVDLFFEMK